MSEDEEFALLLISMAKNKYGLNGEINDLIEVSKKLYETCKRLGINISVKEIIKILIKAEEIFINYRSNEIRKEVYMSDLRSHQKIYEPEPEF